jgi:hypothetical protein
MTNDQAPNPNQIPMTNGHGFRWGIGNWSLEFDWDLGLGHWKFN